MEKIVITATAESYEQARELLELGVDRIYIGEKAFGLRLPKPFSFAEMPKIAELVHESGKELTVAVNALMHQGMMDALPDYLDFLEEIKADYITVGDAGVFYICNRDKRPFKMIYDASTMVTSSRQINFWGKQAGASEAVLAREIPSAELFVMAENLQIPAEVLVYGASIIHHSKRPLLQNYYNFIKTDEAVTYASPLVYSINISLPMSPSMATTININNANSFVFILRPIFLTGLFLVLAANMIPPIYSGISLY